MPGASEGAGLIAGANLDDLSAFSGAELDRIGSPMLGVHIRIPTKEALATSLESLYVQKGANA